MVNSDCTCKKATRTLARRLDELAAAAMAAMLFSVYLEAAGYMPNVRLFCVKTFVEAAPALIIRTPSAALWLAEYIVRPDE